MASVPFALDAWCKNSWSMSSTGYRTCNFHGNVMRLLLSSALGGHSVGCATTAYVLLLYRDGIRWWCRTSEVLCSLSLSVLAVGSALAACSRFTCECATA